MADNIVTIYKNTVNRTTFQNRNSIRDCLIKDKVLNTELLNIFDNRRSAMQEIECEWFARVVLFVLKYITAVEKFIGIPTIELPL